MSDSDEVLEELFATIESRKEELPEGSYTASLFTHEKGENAVLEKLGEEATEILLAAKDDDHEERGLRLPPVGAPLDEGNGARRRARGARSAVLTGKAAIVSRRF